MSSNRKVFNIPHLNLSYTYADGTGLYTQIFVVCRLLSRQRLAEYVLFLQMLRHVNGVHFRVRRRATLTISLEMTQDCPEIDWSLELHGVGRKN
jgi:hypothetical protein